ncbi:hypothetical protein ACWDSJ_21170 [Nocardia sp. NPDC003482]
MSLPSHGHDGIDTRSVRGEFAVRRLIRVGWDAHRRVPGKVSGAMFGIESPPEM